MKSLIKNPIRRWKRRFWILSILTLVAIFLTACGFSLGGWRNIFQAQDPTSTETEIPIFNEETSDVPTDGKDRELITTTFTKSEPTETKKPILTPSHTSSSTVTSTLTQTPSITFTNIVVYFPPTNTQIPPTNTRIPLTNTSVPPSMTPKPTEMQITEQPTQELTEEPTEEPTEDVTEEPTDAPTEEPTEAQVCYTLTLSHEGQGTDPVANPKYSQGCPIDQYVAGQIINLDHAIPDANWEIDRWEGTINDTNRVKMPASDHTAKVIYGKCG